MRLASHYRKQFAAQRGDRLLFYITTAFAVHAGIVSAVWLATSGPDPEPDPVLASQPIEFVYLDRDDQGAIAAERRAVVNAQAGGDRRLEPATSGAAGSPIKPIDATAKFIDPTVPLIEGELIPAGSDAELTDSSPKGLTPAQPSDKPTSTPQAPSEPSPQAMAPDPSALVAPANLPNLASAPAVLESAPVAPNLATELPLESWPSLAPDPQPDVAEPNLDMVDVAEPELAELTADIPVAASDLAVAPNQWDYDALTGLPDAIPIPVPMAIAPSSEEPPEVLPNAPDMIVEDILDPLDSDDMEIGLNGLGLDGDLNPDQTAIAPPSIAAQRDDLWGEYMAALEQAVYAAWDDIEIEDDYYPQVRITLTRDGAIANLELRDPSGSTLADLAALEAVRLAAPFEPFPAEAPMDALIINLRFNYRLSDPSSDAP